MEASAPQAPEHLSIVVVGHVDHGKSTLLGRLYADTGSLPEGKLERVQAICRQQGKEFEYAFLFDAFLEEQQQGVTIDTARTFFSWRDRQYVIIDAPGHKEFLKNMISGAARAEAALLVIDAREGVREQSKKHGFLLSLLGVRQVAVVLNKMDLVRYEQRVYDELVAQYAGFLAQLDVAPEGFIPASARLGDNVVSPSPSMPWYTGPTVLDALALFRKEPATDRQPLRLPVQDVYKFDARRIVAGRVAAGRLQVGDRLLFSPSNKSATVRSIEGFNAHAPATAAAAGRSIGFTLDEQIFVERGEVASRRDSPSVVSTAFRCNLFCLGSRPLETGKKYLLRLATREVPCEIAAIHRIIDADDLAARHVRARVRKNDVADLTIRAKAPIAFDLYRDFQVTGRFVLVDGHDVCAGGIITEAILDEHALLREEARQRDLSWIRGEVGPDQRAERYGHRPALVLVIGNPQDTSSALARRLESRLVADGRHAYLLHAENLAGRSVADRSELARRFAEVARLLTDAGSIVVSTTDPLGDPDLEAVQAVVHPTPIVIVQVGAAGRGGSSGAEILVAETDDLDVALGRTLEALRARDILASPADDGGRFRYPSYSI